MSLISKCRRVLNVIFSLLDDSPASEFYMPTFRNTVECSETSARNIQTPGIHPKEGIQYLWYVFRSLLLGRHDVMCGTKLDVLP